MNKTDEKKTFTYYGSTSTRDKAAKRAEKVGESLSEVIEQFLEVYAFLPIKKNPATGKPVKISFLSVDEVIK